MQKNMNNNNNNNSNNNRPPSPNSPPVTPPITPTQPLERWDEWVHLKPLLDQLPDHFQRGLSTSALHITCLAAFPDHLVLGTNVGLVYLAHLPSLNLMRLKCENAVEGVTCVAGLRTVEDMIAAGGSEGTITVFQLPRTQPPNSNTRREGRGGDGPHSPYPPIKRFTVTTIHSARITALTWSMNGLLLFSGDTAGVVGLVEVEPSRCQCTARHLITEMSPVVQLSYLHQRLAVCTLERALVYLLMTGECVQVGLKARKQPGVFGCVWSASAPKNPGLLFTSRPGLRLWAAEGTGEVLHTHIIRDLPQERETRLLNPYAEAAREGEHFSFGLLHSLGNHTLVSHTQHWLVAFDTSQRLVLSHSGRFRSINGVAVSENRIFVLEGSRTLLCLSTRAPSDIGSCRVPRSPSQALHDLSVLGSKLVMHGSGFFDQLARVGSSVAAKVTEHAGPAVMTGHKGGGGGGRPGGRLGREEEEEINVSNCGSLSYSSSVLPPPSSSVLTSSSSSSSSSLVSSSSSPAVIDSDVQFSGAVDEVEEACGGGGGGGGGDGDNWGPLVMPVRMKKKKRKNATPRDSPEVHRSTSPGPGTPHGPQDSPGDIHTNIQEKESLLASILDMECLKLDHPIPDKPLGTPPGTPRTPDTPLEEWTHGGTGWEAAGSPGGTQCSTPSTIKEASPAPSSVGASEDFYARFYRPYVSMSSMESGDTSHTSLEHGGAVQEGQEEEEEDLERIPSNYSEDRSSCLSYGPPSGSSLTVQPPAPPPQHPQPPRPCQGQVVTLNDSTDIADITWTYSHDEEEEEEEEMSGGWIRRGIPGRACSLAASLTCKALVNTSGHLYLAGPNPKDPWRKVTLTRDALQVSLGPQGDVGWVVVAGGEAYAFLPPPSDVPPPAPPTKMAAICKGVCQASVAGEHTWFVDEGWQVCVCPSISEEAAPVQVPGRCGVDVVRVAAWGQVVWALTPAGQVLVRVGITTTSTTATKGSISVGQEWRVMGGPDSPEGVPSKVVGLALGPGGQGWVVDAGGRLFFREGVCDAFPQGADLRWWQVLTSKYMVGEEVGVGGVLLCASPQGLWLAEFNGQSCCIHRPVVRGHWWDVCGEEVWAAVCAEGLYTTQGALCCLSPLGQLFLINPNTASCVPLEVPSSAPRDSDSAEGVVVCVSQRPEVLWALTSAGRVFIRAGLSASSLIGTHWEELDLTQIGKVVVVVVVQPTGDIQLCHLSCSTEVVWGVDTQGGVYMRQGPLTPCHAKALPPAWIQVEPFSLSLSLHPLPAMPGVCGGAASPGVGAGLVKACVRTSGHLPGAVCGPVLGVCAWPAGYTPVPTGEVFQRTGVSANNFIGDAWERVPGRLAALSVTTDNTLWGLNTSGHLCHHSVKDITTTTTTTEDTHTPRTHSLSLSEQDDWEVV